MIRAGLVLLVLAAGAVVPSRPPLKWPLQARVTDLHGRPVAFQARTLGGDLIVQVGERTLLAPGGLGQRVPDLRTLERRDTLRATTPASYSLDLKKGPVVFFTPTRDSIRLVVAPTPLGGLARSATAVGRRLTARLSNGSVIIDAR
jgi:hypothetical protein